MSVLRFVVGLSLLVAVLLPAVLASGLVAAADVALPACGPARPSSGRLIAPDRLAIGRVARFDVVSNSSERAFNLAGASVTVAAVDGKPLKGAYTDDHRRYASGWPLRFAPGDGPAQVTVVFPEGERDRIVKDQNGNVYLMADCMRSVSRRITPVEGSTPQLGVPAYDELRVRTYPGGDNCDVTKPGALTFRLRSHSLRRKFRLSDACGEWAGSGAGTYAGRGFRIVLSDRDFTGAPALSVVPVERHRNARRSFVITSYFRGKRLRTVRFRIKWAFWRDEYIDEAEDDFVNYCINESRPIYKRNGRLYCIRPGGTYTALHIRR